MIDALPSMPSEQVIARKLAACGLDRGAISVTWQDDLQSVLIVIRHDARASADQFACIHDAGATAIVTFEDQSLEKAYADYTVELYRPRMIADTRASVTKLGLIDGFPRRSDYADLRAYAEALERHCGVAPGSVLRVSGDAVAFDPPHEGGSFAFTGQGEKLIAAVMYALAIGDLENLGFIGNEAYAVPEK